MTPIATTIPIVEEDAATGAVAEAYADYRTRFGREHVPGILKCFATHPPLLEQMLALACTLLFTESHLSRKVKEMIATYISALNACPYCLDSHASASANTRWQRRIIAGTLQREPGVSAAQSQGTSHARLRS